MQAYIIRLFNPFHIHTGTYENVFFDYDDALEYLCANIGISLRQDLWKNEKGNWETIYSYHDNTGRTYVIVDVGTKPKKI